MTDTTSAMDPHRFRPGRDFFVELGFYALCLLCAGFLRAYDPYLMALLFTLIVLKELYWRTPGDGWFIAGGALFGVGLDLLFVWRGLHSYVHVGAAGVPLWSFAFWSVSVMLLRRIVTYVDFLSAPDEQTRLFAGKAGELVIFAVLSAVLWFWRPGEVMSAACILAALLVRLAAVRESGDTVVFLLVALGSAMTASFFVARHVLAFPHSEYAAVPLWLPLFWGYFALLARRAIRPLEHRLNPVVPFAYM
ncbi:MAG: DUF2878 family protein [Candidatus Schekmanbacteria bacterium]|nr:DUF2878 family protein [Candidatus Schekmanbacteria bacterium]